MKTTGGTIRCEECFQPVSMRPERESGRVQGDDGKWRHLRCATPGPEEVLLRRIFGEPSVGVGERRRVAADELGASVGHRIALDRGPGGVWWVCSCGMKGAARPDFNKGAAKAGGRRHLRNAYIDSADA